MSRCKLSPNLSQNNYFNILNSTDLNFFLSKNIIIISHLLLVLHKKPLVDKKESAEQVKRGEKNIF